jgi:hypothetical protein
MKRLSGPPPPGCVRVTFLSAYATKSGDPLVLAEGQVRCGASHNGAYAASSSASPFKYI